MKRSLRAFVSYRHADAFAEGGVSGKNFILNVETALVKAGFADVFVDIGDIQPGENFENRIHKAIGNCDLFVPLIRTEWLAILHTKLARSEPDILLQEIYDAIRLDKEIIPVLVDNAEMPDVLDLPESIQPLHYKNGIEINSDQLSEEIASKFAAASEQIGNIRRLGPKWFWGYPIFASLSWVLSALVPNFVGSMEFGRAWPHLAMSWSGLFIWPIFVLPFTLLALCRSPDSFDRSHY
jgi:hypothetical protein